jgi:Predicted membrane protein
MDFFFKVDWSKLFVPNDSVLEMFIRGTLMFFAIYALMRFFRRQSGALGMADLLVIVVIADAGSNGMTGEGFSITESVIVITVIVLWDWAFDWLGFKSKLAAKILDPEPLELIKNGRVLRRNLDSEMMTEEELAAQLRLQGIENAADVKQACLEGNGEISIIKFDDNKDTDNKPDRKAVI